ncbi:MAG TPA: mechanosensitive ion channel family protein [Polyangiaceae bacterium]|nr:mechanosensitive ion channel family protein [Polyangiaceae bacterium]
MHARRSAAPLLLFGTLLLAAAPAPAEAAGASPVRLGDSVVFSLGASHHGKTPAQRANEAARNLETLARERDLPELRVERSGETALILAGNTPIVELGMDDAELAHKASLDAYALETSSAVRKALGAEHQRGRIAETVFSWSLLVFFALIAFYLIKKVTSVAERLRSWLDEHGDRTLRVSVKNIEIVSPALLQSCALILVWLVRSVGQFGIFYAWLMIVLSLFEATRGYTERLTGFVLAPLSQLLGRAITALPLLVVAGVAGLAVFVLVRFVGLFLASVSRRETVLAWLPADLAAPASVLLRAAVIVCALVFGAPIVTGSADGSLGRSGAILLVALGLAATPLFASGLLGAVMLFGRRLELGEYVEIRGRLGRVSAINLLELRLETSDGTERRIPHLLLWASAIERLGRAPRLSVEIIVAPHAAPARVLEVLTRGGERSGRDAGAEVLGADGRGTRYRVSATCPSLQARSPLLIGVLDALAEAGIPLGSSRAAPEGFIGPAQPGSP